MSGNESDDEDWFEAALDETTDEDDESDQTFETDATADADTPEIADSAQQSDRPTSQDGDSLFEEDFSSEFESPDVGDESDEDESEDSLFDEGFSSALESAGQDGEAEEEPSFDDEEFESEIPRIDLGIEGLDGMIQGGIPHRHLMVVIGSPGTGKTTFALQFLQHGLKQGESAVFVTLEQSRESILDTADERGWAFDRYEREDKLAIVDLDPVEMANSLRNIRGEFPELVREFDADRLVLDSVSLLEMMYDDQARRRTEVFDFTRSLKQAGVTTMLTSEASEDNPYASRHGIIEYLTDAVFVLQYVRGDSQETRLAVEIQKIRNANHSRQTKPYAITLDGIDVYQQASIF